MLRLGRKASFKGYSSVVFYTLIMALLLAAVYLLWFVHQSSSEVRLLNQTWREHGSLVLQKQDLLHEMKTRLGYTGFIHNFKNYVIRREEAYLRAARDQLRSGLYLISEYKALVTSDSEREALVEIENVIQSYADKVGSISHEDAMLLAVKQLDRQVKVDDTPALHAIRIMNESIESEYAQVKKHTEALIDSSEYRIVLLAYLGVPVLVVVSLFLSSLIFRSARLSHNLNALIQVIPDGFLVSDEAGRIVLSNNRLVELFGYGEAELEEMTVEDLMTTEAGKQHKADRADFIRKPQVRHIGDKALNISGQHKNGAAIPLDIAISSIKIANERYGIALIRDKRTELALIEKSETDFLTATYNRMGVERILLREIERFHRYQRPLSLMVIDVDSFKQLNDSLGHLAGDSILTVVADTLKKESRPSDIVGRWGGDEFCIVCTETTAKDALEFANRCRNKIRKIPALKPLLNEKEVTLSIGISEMKKDSSDTFETLFARADKALYQVKSEGRNNVRIY